jgi:hypothetical protein
MEQSHRLEAWKIPFSAGAWPLLHHSAHRYDSLLDRYAVHDVSAQKCGWDITSQPPATIEGALPEPRHIEVKGRVHGSDTITVTRNEILYGLNQQEKFVLAIVLVNGEEVSGPHYIRRPFAQEPDWATTSVNLDLKQLLSRAEPNMYSEAAR